MTQIPDGGPAFPSQVVTEDYTDHYTGMTLRDYFAAKALQAVVAKYGCDVPFSKSNPWTTAAEWAYDAADKMLLEREKGGAK